MPKTTTIPILGEDATPEQIRRLLMKIDLRQCRDEKGRWVSPVTGEIFESFYQLSGHIGARLRVVKLTPLGDARADYVKALRRGEEPSEAARAAHREYQRKYRERRRAESKSEEG